VNADGVAVVNLDEFAADDWIARTSAGRVVGFSFKSGGDLHAEIVADGEIDIVEAGETHSLQIPLVGEHNLQNALTVAAVCRGLGVEWSVIQAGLAAMNAVPGRLVSSRVGGVLILDDSYNANPASATARRHGVGKGVAFSENGTCGGCGESRARGAPRMMLLLSDWLGQLDSGFEVLRYVTLRSIMAALTALLISLLIGPRLIRFLTRESIGQQVRDDGPASHFDKRGTPTMGGALILVAMAVSVLLWSDLGVHQVWIVLITTLAFGVPATRSTSRMAWTVLPSCRRCWSPPGSRSSPTSVVTPYSPST